MDIFYNLETRECSYYKEPNCLSKTCPLGYKMPPNSKYQKECTVNGIIPEIQRTIDTNIGLEIIAQEDCE